MELKNDIPEEDASDELDEEFLRKKHDYLMLSAVFAEQIMQSAISTNDARKRDMLVGLAALGITFVIGSGDTVALESFRKSCKEMPPGAADTICAEITAKNIMPAFSIAEFLKETEMRIVAVKESSGNIIVPGSYNVGIN